MCKLPAVNICHKDKIDPLIQSLKPPPYPYKEKKYGTWDWLIGADTVEQRFDENTVFITVEGPPACGKSDLAKGIAECIDAKFAPEPNMDINYKNEYNFDLRAFNRLLYRDAQYVDHELWLKDPSHPRAGMFQRDFLKVRFYYHLDHMLHLLSTGQGVVMERTPHSDLVFAEAMYRSGYITRDSKDNMSSHHLVLTLFLSLPFYSLRFLRPNALECYERTMETSCCYIY